MRGTEKALDICVKKKQKQKEVTAIERNKSKRERQRSKIHRERDKEARDIERETDKQRKREKKGSSLKPLFHHLHFSFNRKSLRPSHKGRGFVSENISMCSMEFNCDIT